MTSHSSIVPWSEVSSPLECSLTEKPVFDLDAQQRLVCDTSESFEMITPDMISISFVHQSLSVIVCISMF